MGETRSDDIVDLVGAMARNGTRFREAIMQRVRADLPPGRLLGVEEELSAALDRLLPAVFSSLRTGERLDEEDVRAIRLVVESWARRGMRLRTVADIAIAAGEAAREMTRVLADGSDLAIQVSFGQGVRVAQECMTAIATGHTRGLVGRRIGVGRDTTDRVPPPAPWPGSPEPPTPTSAPLPEPPPAGPSPVPRFDPPASEVLSLVAAGRTNVQIAATLHMSRQAVNYHVGRMMRVVGASNRAALVARAYETGLLPRTG